jgi:hypothetical protein
MNDMQLVDIVNRSKNLEVDATRIPLLKPRILHDIFKQLPSISVFHE